MVNGNSLPLYSQYQQQQQQQQYIQQQRKSGLFNINFRNGIRNGSTSHLPDSPPYAVVPSFLVKISKDIKLNYNLL
jgi:hypothetical protein